METDGVLCNMIEDLLGAGGIPDAGETDGTGETSDTANSAGDMDKDEEDEIGGWV